MTDFLLVGVGGFLGSICRAWVGQQLNRPTFPYGTLVINLAGAFLLGMIAGSSLAQTWVLLFGTGFIGAFTTFSTFKWESIQFYHAKEWRKLGLYLGVSYTVGIALAFVGYWITRYL